MRPAEIPVRRARNLIQPRGKKCAKNRGLGGLGGKSRYWGRCGGVGLVQTVQVGRVDGAGKKRKDHVDLPGALTLSKPSVDTHPYVEKGTEDGTWDSAEASASQQPTAREASNRPPTLVGAEKRGELREKRTQNSAMRGQVLAALKGMCERGKEDGALKLLTPHRTAICDLVEKKMLGEVSVGEGWKESYVKDLPWSPDMIDETKQHATQAVHNALIAALCNRSEKMRNEPDERSPKPFPKSEKTLSALEQIAENGLTVNMPGRSDASERRDDRDEPQAKSASATAAASVRDKNEHIEALEQQQTLAEKRLAKVQQKLDAEVDNAKKEQLKQRIKDLESKIEAREAEIDALY
eukprot:COSAG02_NODE_743_length_17764_cov_9.908916_8_plen_352_part_00